MTSGYNLNFSHGECTITDEIDSKVFARVRMTAHRLFPFDYGNIASANAVFNTDEELKLWHRRFGHLNVRSLQFLAHSQLVKDMPDIISSELENPCEACALGKQTRHSFPQGSARRATSPLELVHGDLVGPMQVPSMGGNRYMFLLTDDYSRYSWVYFIANEVRDLGALQGVQTAAREATWFTLESS